MANLHAKSFREIEGCRVVAGVDVDRARATEFCARHGIPAVYESETELLAREDFDAVSIVAPDAFHASLSIRALEAGKHVLCEKPLALNHRDARRMLNAARKAGVIHMVNFSYRNWPALQAVAELVAKGGIGKVRHVEASYLQSWLASRIWGDWRTTPAWLWRLSTKHGSRGVLGDVGVHILDFATFPAGPISEVFCRLKAFPKAPRNRIGDYLLDANDSAVMSVQFRNGALGTIHTTRWAGGHANRLHLKISGTLGAVEIDSERSTDSFRLSAGADLDAAKWSEVPAAAVPSIYQRFVTAVRSGVPEQPDFARGAEIQRVIDACFESDRRHAPVRLR